MVNIEINDGSLVESEHPISHTGPPSSDSCDAPEASMVFSSPLQDVLVSSIAERSICTEFTVAKFEVPTFRNIEAYRSTSSHNPLALPVAEWTDLRMTTSTPVIDFSSVQINMGWIQTLVGWHAWWSISSFLIRSTLC